MQAHEVGDSPLSVARETGSGDSTKRYPGFRLRLHPGLDSVTRFAGSL